MVGTCHFMHAVDMEEQSRSCSSYATLISRQFSKSAQHFCACQACADIQVHRPVVTPGRHGRNH